MYLISANLHIHSKFSDGVYSPKTLLLAAKRRGIELIAITDHNEIRGTLEAFDLAEDYDMMVILGIELFCYMEGRISELLVYFRRKEDIIGFFKEFRAKEFIPKYDNIDQLLTLVRKYDGLSIAPHPYAHKGLAGHGTFGTYDGVEVANSFITKRENEAARQMAEKYHYHQFGAADLHFYKSSLKKAFTILESEQEITIDEIWANLSGKKETINFIPQGGSMRLLPRIFQEIACVTKAIGYLVWQDYRYVKLHDFKKFQRKDERFSHV